MSNVSRCEIALLNHNNHAYKDCKMKTVMRHNFWNKLQSTNSWIFSLTDNQTGNLICDRSITTKNIVGTSILTIASPCMFKLYDTILQTKRSYTTHLESSFIPSVNIQNTAVNATHIDGRHVNASEIVKIKGV